MLLLQINNNLRHPDEMSWNHVSMCILNGGSIRSPIDERNNGMLPAPGPRPQLSVLSDQSPKTPPTVPGPSAIRVSAPPEGRTQACVFLDAFAHRGSSQPYWHQGLAQLLIHTAKRKWWLIYAK